MTALRHTKSGFTLIELLVAIAVAGVLIGGGLASYRTFNDRQRVMSAGKEYVQLLRLAQKNAKSGQKPPGCGVLYGYRTQVTIGSSTVTTSALCDGATTVLFDSEKIFDSDIVFSQSQTFDFLVLSGGVVGAGSVSVTNLQNDYTYQVEVSSAGSIMGTEL